MDRHQLWLVPMAAALIGALAVNQPDTVQGIAVGLLIGAILLTVLYDRTRRRPDTAWWFQIFLLGLLVRFGFSFVHLFIGYRVYGGAVDFSGYHRVGGEFARALWYNPLEFMRPFLGKEIQHPLYGLLFAVTGGSVAGMFLISGVLGFLGSYFFLRAFETEFPAGDGRRFLGSALFLLPTFAYWAGILGKDSWIFFLLGAATCSFTRLMKRARLRYVLGLLVSLYGVTLLRPPAGVVTGVTLFCAWWVCQETPSGPAVLLRPVKAVAIIVGLAVVTLGGAKFVLSGYEIEQVASIEDALMPVFTHAHRGLAATEGAPEASGSSLPVRVTEPSLGQMVAFIPEGVFTFLFRPLVFEAHNVLAFVAALEATLFLVLVLGRWRRLVAAVKAAGSSPLLSVCLFATVALAVLFGFERNFGVIVRHRSMALPFLLILLAAPRARPPEALAEPSPEMARS